MNAGAEGDKEQGRRAGGGPRPKKRPLGLLSTGVNDAILEMCVENKGRPLARALTDFVEYTIEALASGYAVEALLLELQLLDSTTRVPGQTLTGVEKRYRTQWITAMHAVMQHLDYVERQEPKSAEEFHIKSQVDVVLRGRQTNDEQTFVKFDKALATGGVAGGVATERIVISPQMDPPMGSASSVSNDTAFAPPNRVGNVADGEARSPEEFSARAQLLASKYHDLRLQDRGDVDGEERKRLSRQLQRDGAVEQHGGKKLAVIGPALGDGLGCTESGHTGLSSEAAGVVSDRSGGTAKDASHDESQQRQFIHRFEMVGFARELGYDITPEQATGIFDMLDSQGQGQISIGDIVKYFLPLLQSVGHSRPPRKVSTARRKSSKGPSPRRPRPSTSRPSDLKTPPRPAGTPPPTAKRRVTLSPPEGPGYSCSSGPAPLDPTKPSREEKRKGSTTGTLNPISSPNRLEERPSKFWLKPHPSRDLVPPASSSFSPLSTAVGQVDERASFHDDGAEKVERLGERISCEEDQARKDPVASTDWTNEKWGNGLSVIQKSAGGSEGGYNYDAEENDVVETSLGSGRKCRARSSSTLNSKLAAVDLPYGKNVLDWTTADVLAWVRGLPRGLAAFAEAEAFANGQVDGKRLATLKLSDIKRKEFHHAKFNAKIPTALWVEIKQIQLTVPAPTEALATVPVLPSRFVPGQTIVDESVGTPLCTVKQPVGQGAFGEVYQVVWTGIGADRGATLAMKTTRLADISSNERDEYRVLLVEEILTAVRIKPHPNVVNVRFAHIMGFCSESEEYFCFEDFVTGRNLEELVSEGEGEGELYKGTPAEVQGRLLSYSIQLARGLAHIHSCGVLHQDLKSSNIMGRRDNSGGGKEADARQGAQGSRPKIVDVGRPPNRDSVLYGTIKGYTPRYQSPEVNQIMERKCKAAAAVARAAAQTGDRPSKKNNYQDSSPPQSLKKHEPVDQPHIPFTHRSDMWAAGVVILEMYAGGLTGLKEARGDNALDFLETCARHTTDMTTAEYSRGVLKPNQSEKMLQHERGGGGSASATGQNGGQSVAIVGEGSVSPRGNGCTKRRIAFRVDMPRGVLAVLRDIFQQEAGDRPESMEVLAARLSQTLACMLEKKLAVVPCATTGAPSPSSLCEESRVCVEFEENHAKVGRLHMWLGKALFLKGEDRREQALQEYREGVRVLAQSEAESRSPSMALFRWYLGKALLENGEIDEALPHLVEAVSIDPESAKYRHTLGLAKCATGDEAGARQDLLEAALLDEEDAEDRYQLRMQRISEKRRKNDEQQRTLKESQGFEGAGSTQGASSSESRDTETDKPQQAMTPTKTESPGPTSSLSPSQLLALEKASVSTRTYALEKLSDYRTDRGVGRGGGDYLRGGLGGTMDARGAYSGDKGVRDAVALPSVQRFSVGDEIVWEPTTCTQNSFEPLRCCRSSYRIEADFEADSNGIFTIDGLVSPGQASLCFPGEAYTATWTTMDRRRQTSGENGDSDASRSFHAVRIRLESGKNRPVASTGVPPKEEENALATFIGHKQLAPIDEKQLTKHGADAIASSSPAGVVTASVTAASASVSSSSSNQPRGSSMASRSLSTTHAVSRSPTRIQREEEYVLMLKAAGRAAIVGFHARLAGALRHLTWSPGELILVADKIPSACSTLREVCVSGSIYRETGKMSNDGGRGRQNALDDKNISSSVVVGRMLELARQTAAAISHCHSRGILLRDITPSEVLVTPEWNAILRPNYFHAHEGRCWTTVSVREQQNVTLVDRSCSGSDDKHLVAPFTSVISSDYQSPEIARIRSENEPRQRVSGRALRLSAASSTVPARSHQEEQDTRSLSPTGRQPSATSPEPPCAGKRGQGGSGYVGGGNGGGEGDSGVATTTLDGTPTHYQGGNGGSSQDQLQGDNSKLARTTRSSLIRRRGRAESTGGKLASGRSSPLGSTASTVPGGVDGEPPMISACESDIWAWALMVLLMFSDEPWPPGCGQKGLPALEALLQRRRGVDAWTIDDVITWLREIGLWTEKTEREIRAFKIAGPQLLVPTCRRDIVERLGLFIADGELSCKLWDSIAGGLQRWSVPPRLAQVLRRCLADSPDDRFPTMDEVCKLLHGISADNTGDGDAHSMPTRNDDGQDAASDRLRTGMILNDIGVRLCGRGLTDEAERYYKMALLSSDSVVEAYYNLGLLYIAPAFNKFQEARQVFDAATERMGKQDARRKASIEHSKAAERKSNYHQSQEMMKALSGKYSSVPPKGRQRASGEGGGGGGGAIGSAARKNHPSGGGTVGEDNISRRASFPPAHKSSTPLKVSSASSGTSSWYG
eukprot:g12931.t1